MQKRNRALFALGIASSLAILAGCGGDGLTFTGPWSDQFTIGPEGGTRSVQGGQVTMNFPQNAVAQQSTIVVDNTVGTLPADAGFVGGSAVRITGPQLQLPIGLQLRYVPGNVPSNVNQNSLHLVRLVNGQWVEVEDSVVNVGGQYVGNSITQFGTYGVRGYVGNF
jgi:hypothetical protein